MKISLLLTSRDKREELKRFFLSCVQQTYKNFEVIFADQGNNYDLLANYKDINIVYKKISLCSLSKARNIILPYVSGDILMLADDDCWYEKFFFERVVTYFIEHKGIALLLCNVKDPSSNRIYANRPVKDIEVNLSNIFFLSTSIGICVNLHNISDLNLHFEEQLGVGTYYGSGEDVFFAYKILQTTKHQGQVMYKGNIFVYHPVVLSLFTEKEKGLSYGLGTGALAAALFISGNNKHFFWFVDIFARSIVAAFFYIIMFNKELSFFYLLRTKGLLLGFWKYYKQNR